MNLQGFLSNSFLKRGFSLVYWHQELEKIKQKFSHSCRHTMEQLISSTRGQDGTWPFRDCTIFNIGPRWFLAALQTSVIRGFQSCPYFDPASTKGYFLRPNAGPPGSSYLRLPGSASALTALPEAAIRSTIGGVRFQ